MSQAHPPMFIRNQIAQTIQELGAGMASGYCFGEPEDLLAELAALVYRDALEIAKECGGQEGVMIASTIRERMDQIQPKGEGNGKTDTSEGGLRSTDPT